MTENALQATLASDFGQVLKGIQSLQTEMKATKAEVKALAKDTNGFQQQAVQGFSKTKLAAIDAMKGVGGLKQEIKDAGGALARLGGPLGELSAKIGGAGGMRGSFALLSGAAIAAGLAFRGLLGIADRAAQAANRAVTAAKGVRDAARSGEDSALGQAGNVLGKSDAIGQAVFRGGPKALDEVQAIAQREGISIEEAASGYNATANLDPKVRDRALRAAALASRSGLVDFTGAAQQIGSNDMLQRSLGLNEIYNNDPSQQTRVVEEAAARLVTQATAKEGDVFAKADGTGWEANLRGIQRVGTNDVVQRLAAIRGRQSRTFGADLGVTMRDPGIDRALDRQLGRAEQGSNVALNDLMIQQAAEVARLNAEAAAALASLGGRLEKAIDILGIAMGGEGPREDRANRAQTENSKAMRVIIEEDRTKTAPRSY